MVTMTQQTPPELVSIEEGPDGPIYHYSDGTTEDVKVLTFEEMRAAEAEYEGEPGWDAPP
jgi:hypothetical protein